MTEAPSPHLAVARLTESAGGAPFRRSADRPLEGYCLLTGDARECRVTLYLENARTLSGRRPGEFFYYEGWLMSGGMPVSLGAFNTGAAGDGSGTCLRPPADLGLGPATGVTITAEPFGGSGSGHTPVLEGQLVWLQGPAPEPAPPPTLSWPPPDMSTAQYRPALEMVGAAAATPWAGLLAGAGLPSASLPGADPTPPLEPQPEPSSESEPEWEHEPERKPERKPEPEPEPEPEAEPEAQIGFKLYPEPAVPVLGQGELPDSLSVPLTGRHPLAPRAGGTAAVQLNDGGLTLTVRGLPTPAALGKEQSTGRPYNTYRVWLHSRRSGTHTPVGMLTRIWGENFRFQSAEPLPLSRHDTILITADDRAAVTPNQNAPQILTATYLGVE